MATSLEALVKMYVDAEDATVDSRAEAERDRDYRNGVQWTAEEVATLAKRKQPVITIDRIGPKIDFLLGMEVQQRVDPKAYPRTEKDEDAANAATDALNYVLDANRWDRIRSECFDAFLVEGACGIDITLEQRGEDMDVVLLPIAWDRLFYDPHSRRRDFSDAKYLGQVVWMDAADAADRWPDSADAIEATLANESQISDTYADVPRLRWSDGKRKRVRIVSVWHREKTGWKYCVFTKAGILEQMDSPFVDAGGESVPGFVFGSNNIDRDGNRFGVVRRWISLQDEINKRRSKAMHLMNVRQTFGNQSIGDKNKLRAELARPDGHAEMAGGAEFGKDFGIIPTNDMAAAQFQLLQEAKQEIDAVGVNAALAGTESRVMSGRALIQRSEQGMNELGPVFDAFKQFQLDVYRAIWNRIKQFWTKERWIRVTDEEKNARFVGINTPMTLGEQLLDEVRQRGEQVTPEMEQQARMDPAMQQIVGVRNQVSQLDVDIVVDTVQASAALQAEQFEQIAKLAQSGVPIPPDVIIQASNLRNKQAIIDRMTGKGEQQQLPPQVMQAMQAAQQEIMALQQQNQQLQQQLKAGIDKTQIEAQSRERIAAMNNDARFDEATLSALADMIKAKIQPPAPLAAEVGRDLGSG